MVEERVKRMRKGKEEKGKGWERKERYTKKRYSIIDQQIVNVFTTALPFFATQIINPVSYFKDLSQSQ